MDDYEPETTRDFNDYICWFLWVCTGLMAFGLIWRAVVPPDPREQLKYPTRREILRDNRFCEEIHAEDYRRLESTTGRVFEVTAY